MLMPRAPTKVLPPRVMMLHFRYGPNFPTNTVDWFLDASSNLHDWFLYPKDQYQTFMETNGETTILVTNSYPQMFFRIGNP